MRAIHPLRAMTADEEQALRCMAEPTSERVDVVQRTQVLLGVRGLATRSKVEMNASEICNSCCGSV
jgi:hypothetical protein